MSMTDPITITVNAVPYVLARVEWPSSSSTVYKDPTDVMKLTISHLATKAGRTRRLVRLDFSKVSPDPFTPTINRTVNSTISSIVDEPTDAAFGNAELLNLFKGLTAWETDAIVNKVLAGES